MWEFLWPILTIAVTLFGVGVVILSAAEPLLVAVAERRPGQPGHRHSRAHLRHRGRS
jgi:hypothetical protein